LISGVEKERDKNDRFWKIIIQRVADRGATVKVLDKPWLDLTTQMGKGILHLKHHLLQIEYFFPVNKFTRLKEISELFERLSKTTTSYSSWSRKSTVC